MGNLRVEKGEKGFNPVAELLEALLLATPQNAGGRKRCFLQLQKMQETGSTASCYSAKCRRQEALLLVTPQNAGGRKHCFLLLRKMQETVFTLGKVIGKIFLT